MPPKSNQPASSWPEGKPPADLDQFYRCLDASRVLVADDARQFVASLPETKRPQTPKALAIELIKAGKLTRYQGQALLQGKIKYLTFGEYIVLDRLGRGGMGEVLKAEHRRMGRTVALKVISSDAMKDADAVRRFQREVHAAARLIHPNIVTAFDANDHQGVHFLVMEYVEGRDLAAIVHDLGALPVATAIDYIAQAARGLAYAHSKGVVHRDIKPGNLLVDRDGTVKILDMGLARIDLAGTKGDELTSTGQVMGTVDYMAPEQAEDTHSADARADIYSLGCTLYRLLSGETLYGGESVVKKILNHRGAPIPPLASVCPSAPAALDAAFRKMVAKRPQDRQQTMGEVVLELENILRSSAASAPAAPAAPASGMVSDSKLSEFLAGLGARTSTASATVAAQKSGAKVAAAMEVTQDFKASDTSKTVAWDKTAVATAGPPRAEAKGHASRAAEKVGKRSLRWPLPPYVIAIAAALGGLALAAAGVVLFLPAGDGTVRIEINDPSIEVTVSDSSVKLKGKTEEIHVKPGEHTLHVKTGNLEFDTTKFVLGKGENPPLKVELLPGKVQVTAANGNVLGERSARSAATADASPAAAQGPRGKPIYALDFSNKVGQGFAYIAGMPDIAPADPITIEVYATSHRDAPEKKNWQIWHIGTQLGLNQYERIWTWAAGSGSKYDVIWSRGSVEVGKRVHLAGVSTGKEMRFFVDGKLAGTKPIAVQLDTRPQPSYLGGAPTRVRDTFEPFEGTIDELRISNGARYEKDFTPPERFEADADTAVLYNMDEGQGDVLTDSSGHGHHGKIVGAKWVTIDRPAELAIDSWTPREIAAWVFERGGKIFLSGGRELDRIDALPTGAFEVGGIDLNNLKSVGDEEAKTIAQWPSLTGLRVAGSSITDVGLRHLAALKFGEVLIVGGNSITGEGFDAFEGKRLGTLQLCGNPERKVPSARLSAEGWRRVARVGWTNRWILGGSNVTDEGATEIAARHPEINMFGASGSRLSDAALEALSRLPRLRDVSFTLYPGITDEGLLKFKATKTLEVLHAFVPPSGQTGTVTAAAFAALHEALPQCKIIWGDKTFEPTAPKNKDATTFWNDLFNGRDLSGWLQKGHSGWSVKDGVLTGESPGPVGWLMSEREYGDFELELEYRLPPGGNSGVFVRAPESGQVSGSDFNEIQLLDDLAPKFSSVTPQGKNGALFGQIGPKNAPIKATNEWRKLGIRCFGQDLQVKLDGVDVVDGPLRSGTAARGHLGLQLYAPSIAFRNIRLRELTTVVPGNYALEFDGVSNHQVRIPSLIDDGRGPLTVEAWLRPGKLKDNAGAIVAPGNNNSGPRLQISDNAFTFTRYDPGKASAVPAHTDINTGKPIHVAGVREGQSLRIFVDGKLFREAASVVDDQLAGRGPGYLSLGFSGGGTHFAGVIDEVRISKAARYSQDFVPAQRFEPDKDTMSLYHFDEGAGDVLNDSSGNGHHGKIIGAKWVTGIADGAPASGTVGSPSSARRLNTEEVAGGAKPALDFNFNATAGWARVELPQVMRLDQPLTVEMYAKLHAEEPAVNQLLFGTVSKTTNLYLMRWKHELKWNTWTNGQAPGSKPELHFSNVLRTEQRFHVAAVSTGNELRLYLDGILLGRGPAAAALPTEPAPAYLGSFNWRSATAAPLDGMIDEVRVSTAARYDAPFMPPPRLTPDNDTLILYDFREGSGDVLHDSSGHGHDGKIVGAKWVPGVTNSSLGRRASANAFTASFDGVDDYVEIPSLKYDGSHPLTIEAHVKPRQAADAAIMQIFGGGWMSLATGKSGTWGSLIAAGDQHFMTWSPAGFKPEEFAHVAAVWDQKQLRLFVNGKPGPAAGATKPGEHRGVTTIGAGYAGARMFYFGGEIDELRMSKVVRYDRDFTPPLRHEPDQETLALYHFDDGAGEVLTDSSGNGHHGKIVGAKWVPAVTSSLDAIPSKDAAHRTVELLPLIDLKRDVVSGQWRQAPEGLVAEVNAPETDRAKRLQLPYTPPEEYDFEIDVTPAAPNFRTTQHFFAAGRSITWEYDSKPAGQIPYISGFSRLDNLQAQQSPESLKRDASLLTPGQRNRSRIEVRRGSLRVVLNDKEVAVWQGDLTRFGDSGLRDELPNPQRLGVITFQPSATFHKITVREVTGRGTLADN